VMKKGVPDFTQVGISCGNILREVMLIEAG
jgi:hypothetical protein